MPLAPAIIVALLLLAVVAGVWDLRERRIPNWLTFSGIVVGFVLNGVVNGLAGLEFAGLGFLIASAIYMVLYIIHAKSAGDVKLMAAVGAMVGWRVWLVIFFVSSIIGAVIGLIVALQAGRMKRTFSNVGFIMSEMSQGRAPHVRREDVDVQSEKSLRIPGGTMVGLAILLIVAWEWWKRRP